MYHPVWWGKRGGPLIDKDTIHKLAQAHLTKKCEWLVGIEEIYAPKQ